MCGLTGIVHWDGEPIQPETLGDMAGRLHHRGPDELCVAHISPGIGLAHARLKVIDVSDNARQPMASDDNAVWLVYNGEIYNFLELRRLLETRGHCFQSRSDTEVILRAYEAWGTDAFRRLDGMFAVALWDGRRRQLVLARDRVGKKPLFYWTDGRCAVFGSEIKALLAHAHVPREINERLLPFLLMFGYPPAGKTCYRQILQVPPAAVVIIRDGDTDPQPEPYWNLALVPQRHHQASMEQAAQEVRWLLREAVRRRLVADVPIGAFLSGGVDSTIVVGLIDELLPSQPLRTFSIGFEGDTRFNETPYAQMAAARFHTDHTVFTVGPQPFDLIERLVWHHDQPFGDSSALPTYLLSQLTKEHVTVALTGDGGDEVFAGYRRFLAALWAERVPSLVWAAADSLLGWVSPAESRSLLAEVKRFTAGARRPLPERYLHWTTYMEDPDRWLNPSALVAADGIAESREQSWRQSAGWSLLARLLHLNFTDYLPNDLMVKTDRCSMAHGLEARSPFLDMALIEYLAGLPDDFKVRGPMTKAVLRYACRDLLPSAILRREKMGFGVPVGTWFRRQWREPLLAYLDAPGARLNRFLNAEQVRTVIQSHLQGTTDAGQRLWLLLTLEMWLRQLERPLGPREPVRVIELNRVEPAHPSSPMVSGYGS